MMVAWGILFYFKWEIRRSFPEAGDPNTNASRVILATMVTFLSFFSIYVLDKLADMDCTGEITDKAIPHVTLCSIQLFLGAWLVVSARMSPTLASSIEESPEECARLGQCSVMQFVVFVVLIISL